MKIIVCIEDRSGMLFNHRRVSSDKVVCEDILGHIQQNKIWMSSYTAKLFKDIKSDAIYVDEAFLEKAMKQDYCLVEEALTTDIWKSVEEVVLYRWNRTYPYDVTLDTSKIEQEFKRISCSEIKGYSHEKITKEVFIR